MAITKIDQWRYSSIEFKVQGVGTKIKIGDKIFIRSIGSFWDKDLCWIKFDFHGNSRNHSLTLSILNLKANTRKIKLDIIDYIFPVQKEQLGDVLFVPWGEKLSAGYVAGCIEFIESVS